MTHYHFIGIGGTGLSAIARVLVELGHTVSGSDRAESSYTQSLIASGVKVSIGHDPSNVIGADVVVRSSAIPDDNPEVLSAKNFNLPILKRADFLGSLMEGKTGIAIAGTHGKTTTSAMLVWVLTALGQDPTFIVGGVLANLGVNARAGKGPLFVIEADEYDRMFLGLKPTFEIITNVEHDHPDCYPTPEDFQAAFFKFIGLIPQGGILIACAEDKGALAIADEGRRLNKPVVSYGLSPVLEGNRVPMDAYVEVLAPNEKGGFTFSAYILDQAVSVMLQVPGKHNVSNAIAVLTMVHLLGLDLEEAAHALGEFKGTGRRFEIRGEEDGIVVIDDYAHHPTEIRATLAAARSRYPEHRIWATWQPHTYSRIKALFTDFLGAFKDADQVLITDVYAAREKNQDFSSRQIVEAMQDPSVRYSGDLKSTTDLLLSSLQPGDILLVLSAGDADQISRDVLATLKGGQK